MTTTRAEHDLLFCIARRDLNERRLAGLRGFVSAPLDWTYLMSTARTHGLNPLLYRHLNSIRTEVPPAHFAAIKQQSIENCQEVLTLMGRLTELLRVFNQQGLAVLVFKGPILSEIAYGENSLRQAGDVDVLIHRDDFDRAKELLESLGYQMSPPLTAAQKKAHLDFHCEIQFIRDNGFTVIDLHWSLAPKAFPFESKPDDVFARSRETSVGGQSFKTFGVEDLILYQCMHGAKHYWPRLEWIASLAEIVRRDDIDWSQLVERARTARGVKMLALGLRVAEELGDASIPAMVFDEIDAQGSMRLVARETLANIFEKRDLEFSSVRAIKKNFQIMDRKRDVFVSALRVLFVPTLSDWQSLTLPSSLQPLYYVYRPFRLLKAYAVSLMHRLLRVFEVHTASQSVKEPITGGLD